MKEAQHIATGRMVKASEVDYPEYYGNFHCPNCKMPLYLRKYTDAKGTTIAATFYHPKAETELQRNCPERVEIGFNTNNSKPVLIESRNQCFKVLKRKFISNLKQHNKVKLTKYSSKNGLSLECANLLISVSRKIISSPYNGKFIEQQESKISEAIDEQKIKLDEEIDSYHREWQDLYRQKIEFLFKNQEKIKQNVKAQIEEENLGNRDTSFLEDVFTSDKELSKLDEFVRFFLRTRSSIMPKYYEKYNIPWRKTYNNYHCEMLGIVMRLSCRDIVEYPYLDLEIKRKAVKWLLEFLCCDAKDMDKFRTETLDYIFGKYVDNEEIKLLIRNENKGFFTTLDQFLSDGQLIKTFFEQKYKGDFFGENADIFQEIEKIHNLIFRLIIDYLLDFPWHWLKD
jgi:hypothetical protein